MSLLLKVLGLAAAGAVYLRSDPLQPETAEPRLKQEATEGDKGSYFGQYDVTQLPATVTAPVSLPITLPVAIPHMEEAELRDPVVSLCGCEVCPCPIASTCGCPVCPCEYVPGQNVALDAAFAAGQHAAIAAGNQKATTLKLIGSEVNSQVDEGAMADANAAAEAAAVASELAAMDQLNAAAAAAEKESRSRKVTTTTTEKTYTLNFDASHLTDPGPGTLSVLIKQVAGFHEENKQASVEVSVRNDASSAPARVVGPVETTGGPEVKGVPASPVISTGNKFTITKPLEAKAHLLVLCEEGERQFVLEIPVASIVAKALDKGGGMKIEKTYHPKRKGEDQPIMLVAELEYTPN